MSNPFDQFASDFNAALPPAPIMTQQQQQQQPPPPMPMGGVPGSFPQPYEQQPPMYGGFQINMPQQPTFGGYDAPSPQAANVVHNNPYEMQPNPGMMPSYAMETQPAYMAAPPMPQQVPPMPPMPPGPFGEVDPGNPFASPNVGASAGFDGTQPYGMGVPPPVSVSQGTPFESSISVGMPPAPAPPVADPVSYADGWGAPPSASQQQQQQPPAYDTSFVVPQTTMEVASQPQPDLAASYPGVFPTSNPYGPPVPMQQPDHSANFPGAYPPSNPYGQPTQQFTDPNFGAIVPSQQPSNPYASFGQPPNPYSADPYAQPQPEQYGQQNYGMHPGQDPYQQPSYGQAYGYPPAQQQYQAPPPAPMDPFSVFDSQPKALEADPLAATNAMVPYSAPNPVAADDDFWGNFGPSVPEPAAPAPAPSPADAPAAGPKSTESKEPKRRSEEEKKGDEGLPPGGEFYDARIFTPTLGVMFFKPQELTDSLFLNTERDIVDSLAERPVVAFIVEGSSARAAGVELGHVLLKVNGIDVKSPKEASRLIKEGPRPLPLLFYVPNTDVVTAEGEHMVKYDTRETTAPNSAKDWKPKYVVIGGIIAQPWMMNMYRSKSEYDIAVIETQARRPVSVKVKQFSLQGARIQNDWQGPQMVKYKNKNHPWKYIVVLPVARNPIKISSPNLSELKPVHEGIRRVLVAQQRDRVGGGGGQQSHRTRSSDSENYGRAAYEQGSGGDGGYNHHQQQQPIQHNGYAQEARY